MYSCDDAALRIRWFKESGDSKGLRLSPLTLE